MLLRSLAYLIITDAIINAIEYPINTNSEMTDNNNTALLQHDSGSHEDENEDYKSNEEYRKKQFLEDAMKVILDPISVIEKRPEILKNWTERVEELDKDNIKIDRFIKEMENLYDDICIESQEALWSYFSDDSNQIKEMIAVKIASEKNKFLKQFWRILKEKYINNPLLIDPVLKRKIEIIKKSAISAHVPVNKRNDITDMLKIMESATVCYYNELTCIPKNLYDIKSIYNTSIDSEELKYYWKSYRDVTGKRYKSIFKEYVDDMNIEARTENFTDAGEVWRYLFEDEEFNNTVHKLWKEIKPFYNDLHQYVKIKLTPLYKEILDVNSKYIPAHILGNLWAQDWQNIYQHVAPYPNHQRPKIINDQIGAKDFFDAVDKFYISLGFESLNDSYSDINESTRNVKCTPSSHDLCDRINYRINWCGEKIVDVGAGLLQTGRLLGRIQYYKHLNSLLAFYRNEPIPGFYEAISGIVALQTLSPEYMKSLNWTKVEVSHETSMNQLAWLALGMIPKIAYAYVMDRWRWDVFSNEVSSDNWNRHWWDLRENETLLSAPVPRNESDLDPASDIHVVSHKQHIVDFIAYIIEFEVLSAMCKRANHIGPLHECNLYGDAGSLLRMIMYKGPSEDWRDILETLTGKREISSEGIIEYFAPLRKFLEEENSKLIAKEIDNIDAGAPIIFGFFGLLLLVAILVLLCRKKRKVLAFCGISKNGSLDIATDEMPKRKSNDGIEIAEEKF